MMERSSLQILDEAVRTRTLRARAVSEEDGFGITDEVPVRRDGESDSYWFIRLLTYEVVGASYRTPQLNMFLLQDYINSRTWGENYVQSCVYVAPGEQNMRFTTRKGRVDFFAREEIDPKAFLARFGLA